MARFDMQGIDELMKDLSYLEAERIAPLMLEEAEPILTKEVKEKIRPHRDTGDMYKSIKSTGAQRSQNGYYLCVRPTGKSIKKTKKSGKGKREEPVRNMDKLAYLEYGTQHEPARPVLSKATRAAEQPVLEKMQEVFDREVR